MKFYEHDTLWTECRKLMPSKFKDFTWGEFYSQLMMKPELLPTIKASGVNQVLAEGRWYVASKPYFRIWPEMIEALCMTRIDSITGEHLKAPYGDFAILLPEDNDIEVAPGHRMKTLFVSESTHVLYPKDHSVAGERQILLWMNFGERDPKGELVLTYRKATLREGQALEASFKELPMDPNFYQGIQVPEHIMESALRMAMGVCLLATSASKVVEPDILAKHLDAYRAATEARRKELVAKAHRLGKVGWRVHNPDTPRQLVGCLTDALKDEYECHSSGRPLKYSHVRRAHWHLVRYGEKHSLVKPMLFAETTVRKDLPRKEQ